MKKETEKTGAETQQTEQMPKTGTGTKRKSTTLVWCGPTVRGVSRQFAVYHRDIPDTLKEFIEKHPAAKTLLVSVERFAEVRRNLDKSGTAEWVAYKKVKAEL